MLNRISLFGCIVVCLSSHLLRDLLRTSWLLPCFGNYKESCCQALDNFEVTQESRDRSLFTSGLVGHMSVIRSHFLVSSSVTSYPSAGRVPGTLVPLTAPAPQHRGSEVLSHTPSCSCALHQLIPEMCWQWRRNKVWNVWSQCVQVSSVIWHCKVKIWFSSTPSWVEVLSCQECNC